MKYLQIKMSEKGIQEVIDYMTKVRDALDRNEIPEKLAEIGANSAEAAYGFPVAVETGDKAASIIASHEGLSFLEFGAGMATDEMHPDVAEVPYPVYRGSYSDQNHGMYAASGYQYWVFGGHVFDRVVPKGGIKAAGQSIRDNVDDVVREVLWY